MNRSILSATKLDIFDQLCAWCLEEQGVPLGEGSHSICKKHKASMLQQLIAIRRRRRSAKMRITISEDQRLYKFKEAQQYLFLSRTATYQRIQSGQLKGFKIGGMWRFTRAQLDASKNG